MATVQTAFDELAAMVLDPTMHPIQYQEARRFFHAGVLWAVCEFERVAAWEDDPDGSKAYKHMEAVRSECEAFGQQVKAGNA